MADYSNLDEAQMQQMLNDATGYEERSALRKALRQKKKQRGEAVGRTRGRASTYNRFAGSTATTGKPTPKNFVAKENDPTPTTPSKVVEQQQQQVIKEPYPRSHTPTPPPTPELEGDHLATGNVSEERKGNDEVDIPPFEPEEAPVSPPPSPASPKAPASPEPPASPNAPASPEPPASPNAPASPEPPASPDPPASLEPPALPDTDLVSREGVDGGTDPNLGEEDQGDQEVEPVAIATPALEAPVEVPTQPKGRDRQIESEETDLGGGKPLPSTNQEGFQGFKLRKTVKGSPGEPKTQVGVGKVDFGVKLKKSTPTSSVASPPTTRTKPVSKTTPTTGSGPRTLRDFEQLTAKSKQRAVTPEEEGPPMPSDELQKYLVAYVNRELDLHPNLPVRGRALFEVASNATNLCKLINKSVRNTVDLRALTKMPTRGSAEAKKEAQEENMMLVVESARAIGCRVNDSSGEKILEGDPAIIRQLLVDLIRARVVHMPGMEDEPNTSFTNMATLFNKLGISVAEDDTVDGVVHSDPDKIQEALETPPPAESKPTPVINKTDQAELTYEERAALRKAQREKKAQEPLGGDGSELSSEERLAQRRTEREKRRKERECLAK